MAHTQNRTVGITAGPWSFFKPAEAPEMTRGFEDHTVYRIIPPQKQASGCSCVCAVVAGHLNCDGPKEEDVRLMAASPLLLDFVKRFEDAVGVLVLGLPTNYAVAKDLLGLREVARDVIARAAP